MSETQISPVFPQETKAVQEQPKPVRWIKESHKAFQKDLESRGMSPNTVRLYLSALKLYFSLYEQLNVENLHSFKAYLLSHYKVSTVNSRIHGINRFLDFLEEGRVPGAEKISAELEGFRLTAVKEQQKAFLDNVISQEDYERLKYCLKKDGYILWYFVVHFLGSCGLRVSELLQIKAEHIRMEYMDLYSKGGKIRRVFFPESLCLEAGQWLQERGLETGFVFTSRRGVPYTARGIHLQLKSFARRYGIPEETVYPHSFRHRFAQNFLSRFNDIALLADLMGHDSIETTRIYLTRSSREMQQLIDEVVTW